MRGQDVCFVIFGVCGCAASGRTCRRGVLWHCVVCNMRRAGLWRALTVEWVVSAVLDETDGGWVSDLMMARAGVGCEQRPVR